jgi:Zn-dependent M28 family amino/carboxypeptidase
MGTVSIHMKANVLSEVRTTYNVIADSKYGNPDSTVILGGHYDSIFGAGILDNASGVVSMMEIAAALKDIKTTNHLRFGFWGGEELNLLGSDFYLSNMAQVDLDKINYYLDFDVTATKNFTFDVSDPQYAIDNPTGFPVGDIADWDQTAVVRSASGVGLFTQYMTHANLPFTKRFSDVNINGSDDDTFLLYGIPVASLVTGQGNGKTQEEANIFGGTAGNWDVCADSPYVFCDNMDNVDTHIQTIVTKAFAAVSIGLLYNTDIIGNNYHHKGENKAHDDVGGKGHNHRK